MRISSKPNNQKLVVAPEVLKEIEAQKRAAGLGLDLDRNDQRLWDAFFRKVHITESCWYWTGTQSISRSDNSKFYGKIRLPGVSREKYAHRVSYALHKGAIPPGKQVLHICDNELCVNPNHLVLGTALQNSADAVSKGRIKNCENHGSAKLTNKQVHHIKKLGEDFTRTHIAKMFHVSVCTISKILLGKTWRRLPDDKDYPKEELSKTLLRNRLKAIK